MDRLPEKYGNNPSQKQLNVQMMDKKDSDANLRIKVSQRQDKHGHASFDSQQDDHDVSETLDVHQRSLD